MIFSQTNLSQSGRLYFRTRKALNFNVSRITIGRNIDSLGVNQKRFKAIHNSAVSEKYLQKCLKTTKERIEKINKISTLNSQLAGLQIENVSNVSFYDSDTEGFDSSTIFQKFKSDLNPRRLGLKFNFTNNGTTEELTLNLKGKIPRDLDEVKTMIQARIKEYKEYQRQKEADKKLCESLSKMLSKDKPAVLNEFTFEAASPNMIQVKKVGTTPSAPLEGARSISVAKNQYGAIDLFLDESAGKFTKLSWSTEGGKNILNFETDSGEKGTIKFDDPKNIKPNTVWVKCNQKKQYYRPTDTTGIKKPVIYLYPLKKTKINVQVEVNGGEIFAEYPKREKSGWNITAEPSGRLTDKNKRQYNYLFWEAKKFQPYEIDLAQAFCVKGSETVAFLEKSLRTLGLSDVEISDFVTYWMGEMESNKYNLIQFLGQQYTDFAPLTIKPVPDSLIRVFMVFKSSDKKVKTGAAKLKKATRKGYSVIEWGGANLDRPM